MYAVLEQVTFGVHHARDMMPEPQIVAHCWDEFEELRKRTLSACLETYKQYEAHRNLRPCPLAMLTCMVSFFLSDVGTDKRR